MNNHYPYVNAILRSIDSKIFDKSKWQKLAKTDKNSFFKTLTELGYGKSESAGTLEELIDQELLGVKALIDELTPQKNYTDLFFFQSDAINIKYFFKQKYFGITHFDVYVPLGTIPKETLKKAILEGDYNGWTNCAKAYASHREERSGNNQSADFQHRNRSNDF